jgi:hypothetical protein
VGPLAADISTQTRSDRPVRSGASSAPDPEQAVAELRRKIWQPDAAFVLIFASPEFDRDRLARALSEAFPGIPVSGCTTAGEITPAGYREGTITGVSFSKRHFRMKSALVENIKNVSISRCSDAARDLAAGLEQPEGWNTLALQFTDGMSLQEDVLTAAFDAGLAPVPIFGGSAGDGMCFEETFVLHGGAFHSEACLLMLLATDLDFTEITFDHFTPTDRRMVVTDALPEQRVVLELNGEPAAGEYARIIGHPKSQLGPFLFATHPTLVRAGDQYYVRSIQSVTTGGGLRFLSAIDVGLVLIIGEGLGITQEMEKAFNRRSQDGRQIALVLGFDCILRRIEIATTQQTAAASRILSENKVIGFNTYGEQHRGMHVNQTFVGVAFFEPENT